MIFSLLLIMPQEIPQTIPMIGIRVSIQSVSPYFHDIIEMQTKGVIISRSCRREKLQEKGKEDRWEKKTG